MGPLGVYLHIPFCASRCDYCAFATWDDRSELIPTYLAAVLAEVGRAVDGGLPAATSVFFGGGTPSLVPAEDLLSVLAAVPLVPGAEVTVECNPETVSPDLLAAYRAGGVSRLSFGVQSMVPGVLTSLGREHDPGAVLDAVRWARDVGFTSWNVDLIYGAAGETPADWQATLDAVLALEPPHVSAYGLTVELGTPLAARPERHPDDDDQADKYVLADEACSAAGLAWYEVSNWARPGHACRHNQLYWTQGEYQGFGCAAHSHRGGRRWWNVRTPERFVAAVRSGRSAEAGAEALADDERRLEALQLALRTSDGVPEAALPPAGEDSLPAGLVDRRGGRAVLSRSGRLLANEVALRLRPPP